MRKFLSNFAENFMIMIIITLIITLIVCTTILPTSLIWIYFINNPILGIPIGLVVLIISLTMWCLIYSAYIGIDNENQDININNINDAIKNNENKIKLHTVLVCQQLIMEEMSAIGGQLEDGSFVLGVDRKHIDKVFEKLIKEYSL